VPRLFLVKDKEQVASIVRDTNVKLSGKPADPRVDDLARGRVPNDTDAEGEESRFVVERVLNMGIERVDQARAVTGDQAATRPQTEVERVITQVANLPPAACIPGATLSADLVSTRSGASICSAPIEEELARTSDEAGARAERDGRRARGHGRRRARRSSRDTGIYGWPLSPLVRSFGLLLQQTLIYPLVHLFYKVKVTGRRSSSACAAR